MHPYPHSFTDVEIDWTLDKHEIREPCVELDQCHGVSIVEAKQGKQELADGFWTKEKNISLVIKTADCVPVFFYDQSAGIIAAAHAGWRGTAKNISGIMIDTLESEGCDILDLSCVIGHSIASCHYQVKENVAEKFKGYKKAIIHRGNERFLDLASVNKEQLLTKGVNASRIHILSECTYCNADMPSYRRDGEKCGTMYHFIRVK